jgi:hypothetical protein
MWSDSSIEIVKGKAEDSLNLAHEQAESGEVGDAIYLLRAGLLDLARVVLMKNNVYKIIKPSEVLSELRMLDPMTYQLFLRSFKLKGLGERELLAILEKIEVWIKTAVERFQTGSTRDDVTLLLTEAQRCYHGSNRLTMNSEYELAVMEMRQSIILLGKALLGLGGHELDNSKFISDLRQHENEFFEQVVFEHGEYDLLEKPVKRSISEAKFIGQRL